MDPILIPTIIVLAILYLWLSVFMAGLLSTSLDVRREGPGFVIYLLCVFFWPLIGVISLIIYVGARASEMGAEVAMKNWRK